MDDRGDFVPVTDLRMTLVDPRSGDRERLFAGEVHGTRAASLTLPVPPWTGGEYLLDVTAGTTRHHKRSELPVILDASYGGEKPLQSRKLSAFKKQYEGEDFMRPGSPIRVEIFAESGQVASSLPNIIYVRTTEPTGRPVPARVKLDVAEGYISGAFPGEVRTDALGLAATLIYPTYNVLVLEVAATREGEDVPDDPSRGRIVLPVGPQGVRLRAKTPAPNVGEPISLRVHTVGRDKNMFTDLYRNDTWIGAADTTIDRQSADVTAPPARSPGLHVVQAYSSPVPVLFSKVPGSPAEMVSGSISSAHVWIAQPDETPEETLLRVIGLLERRTVDHTYVSHLTAERIGAGGYNPGQAIAFLLSRLDGYVYPPDVAASSRQHDKEKAAALTGTIRTLVIVSLGVICTVVALALGFLVVMSWRAAHLRGETPSAPRPRLSRHDTRWLRQQIFQMGMIIAVVMGTFGLLAVLVAYLRWQIG
jgi:hypothetical protein